MGVQRMQRRLPLLAKLLALLFAGFMAAVVLFSFDPRCGTQVPPGSVPTAPTQSPWQPAAAGLQGAAPDEQHGDGALCDAEAFNAGNSRCRKQVLTGYPRFQAHYEAAPQLDETMQVDAINVFVATQHFWDHTGEWNSTTPCMHRGRPLTCRYAGTDGGVDAASADAQWFHLPHMQRTSRPTRSHEGQAFIGMSMESSANYAHQEDAAFMSQFDINMTYRLDSQAIVLYDPFDIRSSPEATLPTFDARLPAIVYINSNCAPKNEREKVMKDLVERHNITVHSMGKCMHNMDEPKWPFPADMRWYEKIWWTKRKILKTYRVCVAMENSNVEHYLTEKPWDVLATGCVPLYLGAPNAKADFLPANNSAIFVQDYSSVDELAAEIKRVLSDAAAWEERVAWRRRRFADLNPGYQSLVRAFYGGLPHYRCQACQVLADRKWLRMSEGGSNSSGDNSSDGTLA